MSQPVLLDNTVLSNLALVGQMDLVFNLWPDCVFTTTEVLREYEIVGRSGLLPPKAWADLPVVEMTGEESSLAQTFSSRLGAGERSCLAVASTHAGLMVSDDADARAAAQHLGIPVTGTLGILVLAVRRDLLILTQANILLSDMITFGYRSPLMKLDTLV